MNFFKKKNVVEPKVITPIKNVETSNGFKNVKIEIKRSSFWDDITQIETIKVPLGLSEDDEKKFIDEYVYDNYFF